MTVYISIGNSDDKLTQVEWSGYVLRVHRLMRDMETYEGAAIHGEWFSRPHDDCQNACWCVDLTRCSSESIRWAKNNLALIAREFRQDSIAWAETYTEFIMPGDHC